MSLSFSVGSQRQRRPSLRLYASQRLPVLVLPTLWYSPLTPLPAVRYAASKYSWAHTSFALWSSRITFLFVRLAPPPPLQPYSIQRSWSDEHIPVNNFSADPIRHAPRSTSLSASRAPQPQSNNHPPPPPLPPLPPALRPGFNSPPLAHTNLDFTFAEPARSPPPLPPPGSSRNVSNPSHTSLPPLPRATTDPLRSWTQPGQCDQYDTNSFAPPRPVVPPRPHTTFFTDQPIVANVEDKSLFPYGGFKTLDRPPSPPPPVPPRPTVHDEIRFERSPNVSSQGPSSPPPVPPKPDTSPVLLPTVEHSLTPSGHSNPQPIVEILATGSPLPEAQTSEDLSLDSDIHHALTLSLADSHRNRFTERTLEEEDDELARALAESLSFATSLEQNARQSQTDASHCAKLPQLPVEPENLGQHAGDSSGVTSSGKASVPDSGRDILSSEELEDHAAHGQILQELDDEEVTRRLQEEEEQRLEAELRERERQDEERARLDAALIKRLQEEEASSSEAEKKDRERRDEERARMDVKLARREEAEEKAQKTIREAQERMDAAMARRMAESNNDGRRHFTKGVPLAPDPALVPGAPPLPLYNDVVSSFSTLGAPTRPAPRTMQTLPQFYNESVQQPPLGRTASAFVTGSVRTSELEGRGRSMTANAHLAGRDSDIGWSAEGVPSRDPSPGDNDSANRSETPSRTSSLAGVAPQDTAIEPDLMEGVCEFPSHVPGSAFLTRIAVWFLRLSVWIQAT
jgi:hypothetical protein